jgi:hypothetical protein
MVGWASVELAAGGIALMVLERHEWWWWVGFVMVLPAGVIWTRSSGFWRED